MKRLSPPFIVHIINVLPTYVLKGNNPYHQLFQRQPDYTKFKIFGCACYPSLRPYNQHKFVFRSACCLFLGYSIQHVGYICLTPEGKTIISCHVVFNETTFPYSAHPNQYKIDSCTSQVTTDIVPSITVMQQCNQPSSTSVLDTASPSNLSSTQSHCDTLIPPSPTPTPPANTYPMITRAKVGVFKPKAYHTSLNAIPSLPISVKTVIASPIWFTAMTEEYNALLSNKTWTLTSLPPGEPLVGCKWIYKTKLNANGSLQ